METTYNGWKNHATWITARGIDRKRKHWAEVALKAASPANFTREEQARLDLADQIREYVENHNPLAGRNGMYHDLMSAVISEIDYYGIAENWLEDVEIEVEQ